MAGLRPEARFQKKVRDWLDKQPNTWYYVPETGGRRAIPDVIICNNGHFMAWELKKSKAEAKKTTGRIVLQKHEIQKVIRSGGSAYLVYPENLKEMKAIFRKFNRK